MNGISAFITCAECSAAAAWCAVGISFLVVKFVRLVRTFSGARHSLFPIRKDTSIWLAIAFRDAPSCLHVS